MSKKNDWNPNFTRQHKRSKPTRPARREWHSRYHALVALVCFSFAVGVTGDVRWLKAKPEIPVQAVIALDPVRRYPSLGYPGIYLWACECPDDSDNLQRAVDEMGIGGTLYLSGTFKMKRTLELDRAKSITIDGGWLEGSPSTFQDDGAGCAIDIGDIGPSMPHEIVMRHNTFYNFQVAAVISNPAK